MNAKFIDLFPLSVFQDKILLSQDEKKKISEVYGIYSDSTKNNEYTLSPSKVSNLFEINNSLDLEKEIENLSLSIGEKSTFRDDSRDKVHTSLLKISNLYTILNEKENKSK